ncbi:hypothetical protein CsSME_00023084 [Camellia sinensis var. sinensis]
MGNKKEESRWREVAEEGVCQFGRVLEQQATSKGMIRKGKTARQDRQLPVQQPATFTCHTSSYPSLDPLSITTSSLLEETQPLVKSEPLFVVYSHHYDLIAANFTCRLFFFSLLSLSLLFDFCIVV